jgi:predicted restriction endonuclease
LTKKSAVSQETLTKNWALLACFVKKPLQKPFYHKNSPVKWDKHEKKFCSAACSRLPDSVMPNGG